MFSALGAIRIVIKNSPIRKSIKGRINRILPLFEAVVWLGFVLWSIGQLVKNEAWSAIGALVIIMLVIVLLFWLVVRDYLAGIILKTDGSVKLNDWIRVKNFQGKISNLGQRTMEVTTDSGETINIPYSTISGEISAKPNPAEKLINHSFTLKTSRNADVEEVIDLLRRGILNAPWSASTKSPEIKLVNEASDHYHFEINLYSTRMVYFQKIKDALVKSLNSKGFEIID